MPLQPETLKQLGLTEHEAKVYLAMLELGPATVTSITKKAGLTRTLGYVVLEKLGLDGLVMRVKDSSKKMKYVAEHPRSLIQFIRNRKNSWERREGKAAEMLPDLLSLYKIKDKPVIRYQEGVAAIKSVYEEETLQSTTEILSVADVECWVQPEFWDWAKSYHRERTKRKVKERILLLDTPEGRAWLKSYRPTPYTSYRWITRDQAKGLLAFGGELNIYENKMLVALPQKTQRLIAVIESRVLVAILRSMFNIVWDVARPARNARAPACYACVSIAGR